MKLTVFLLLISVAGVLANKSYSQTKMLNLNLREATVKEVLKSIEEQSEFYFLYSENLIDVERKVNITIENKKIEQILNLIFEGSGVEYSIRDRFIVLTTSEERKGGSDVLQQRRTVSGKVTDSSGQPLPGVTVLMKGTMQGTITDIDGAFSLTNVPEKATLQFSFVGMKTKEMQVAGENMIKVVLEEETIGMNEVVVIGYGTQKKVNLSGAVASADTKKLTDRPLTNVASALQGAVANLNIDISSGDPNDLPELNIRGFTSINGGSPLIVIDGTVSDAAEFNHLNPADIANVSVLKDASSAAIYGARAAYGVILVTTKAGKSEKVTVSYNGNFDWRGLTVEPDIVMDPEIYFHDRNQAETGNPNSGSWPTEMFDAIKKWKADPNSNPDYFYHSSWDEYFWFSSFDPAKTYIKNNAFSTTHNINVSGKTEKVNYYVSGNFQSQDGLLKFGRNYYDQYNTRSKVDVQIAPWWNLGMNSSLISTTYDTNSYYLSKHDDSRNNKWSYGTVIENLLSAIPFGPSYKDEMSGYTYDWATQIGQMVEGGDANKCETTFKQQFTTRLDLIKDVFFINGLYNYSLQNTATDMNTLPFKGSGGRDSGTWINNEVSSASLENARLKRSTYDIYGTFLKKFGKLHDLTVILGFNQESYRYNIQETTKDHLISTSIPSVNLAYGTTKASEETTTWALRGLFGRLGYIFNEKYIAEFNFRRDMTSRFPHHSRTVLNPSGSLAWIASQEKFFEPLKNTFNQFKIRASYGRLGNQDVAAYAYIPVMNAYQSSYLIGGSQPMYVTTPGLVSGDLTWEKVSTVDLGIDLAMLKNRLTFTGDIYRRDTKDMLTTQGRTLPSVLGTSVPQENAADLKTLGWDITAGWRDQFNLAGKPFNYSVDLTLSDTRAEITKVANTTGTLNAYYVGQELGEIWGLTSLGLFATDEEAKNWADQSQLLYQPGKYPSRAGTVKWADLNKDTKITRGQWTQEDHGDYKKIGNTTPKYRFGITLGGQWNGFDLSAFFQGVMKHDYYPGWYDRFFWGFYSISWYNEPMSNYTDRWTEENQDVTKFFPRLEEGNAHSETVGLGGPQTRYLQNAAYLRLKNFTLGYTLPNSLTRLVSIQKVRLYYSGENLFCISGLYDGYKADPENLGFQFYPLQKHHSLGVNITF
jgi:TonB-linked SusC/RagA family outer membrane protein